MNLDELRKQLDQLDQQLLQLVAARQSTSREIARVKRATGVPTRDYGREREVLQMLAEGKTNKEIAVVLNLSVYTVDAHRGRIMEKLNVHSINELVRFAVRNGLID